MNLQNLGKTFSTLALSILITGCASLETKQIAEGNYAEAFRNFLYTKDHRPDSSELKSISQRIKDKAGASVQNEFLAKSLDLVNAHSDSSHSIVRLKKYSDYAHLNGLLSETGYNKLSERIYIGAAKLWATERTPLEKEFLIAFPKLDNYKSLALDELYEAAINYEVQPFHSLTKIYKNEIGKSEQRAGAVVAAMSKRIKNARTKKDKSTPVRDFIDAYEATQDKNIKAEIKEYLLIGIIEKTELDSISNQEFKQLKDDVISTLTTQISVVSESDDSIVDEIIPHIAAASEWIEISEDAHRKVRLHRVKFKEKENSSGWRSQVISDVDFATLLFIPKNASVLVDVNNHKYELSWSLNVLDSFYNKNTIITGKKTFQHTECANPRYRNVFGGEGALGTIPSGASFCMNNTSYSFDKERERIIKDIGANIAKFIEANTRSVINKSLPYPN